MADPFTLTVKTGAARRYADRRFGAIPAVADRLDAIERQVANGTPLAKIKELVVDMRSWAWAGSINAYAWFDGWLFDLADWLSTPEERLEIAELSRRFHAVLEGDRAEAPR